MSDDTLCTHTEETSQLTPGEVEPETGNAPAVSGETRMPEEDGIPADQPPKRRWGNHVITVLLIGLGVVILLAGVAFGAIRGYETNRLSQGEASLQNGDWAAAEEYFSQGLSLQASRLMAQPERLLLGRARARYQQGRETEAIADLDAAIEMAPQQGELYAYRALLLMKQNEMKKALQDSQQALACDDTLGLPYAIQAYDAYQNNKFAQAESLANAAIQRDERVPLAYRVRGSLLAWQGDSEAALKDLDRAIALEPNDFSSWAMRVYVDIQQLDEESAVKDTAKLVSAPDASQYWWARALLNGFREHNYADLVDLMNEAVAANNQRPEYYTLLAEGYAQQGQTEEAHKLLDEALRLNPDFIPARVGKHSLQADTINPDQLKTAAQELITDAPKRTSGYLLMAIASARKGEQDDSLKHINRAIEIQPALPDGYLMRSRHYLNQGQTDQAITDAEKALSLHKDNLYAQLLLLETYTNTAKYDKAEEAFKKANAINPNSIDVLCQGVQLKQAQNQKDAAQELLKRASQVNPQALCVQYTQFNLALHENNLLQSLAIANRIVEIYPTYAQGYLYRAMIYLRQQKTEEARREIDQALQIKANDAFGLALLADADLLDGKLDNALRNAERAIQINPKQVAAYRVQSNAYREKADLPRAISSLEKALELDPNDTWGTYRLARFYYEAGYIETAIKLVEKVQKLAPDMPVDTLNEIEQFLTLLKDIPPMVEGKRTFKDSKHNFSISYTQPWVQIRPTVKVMNISLMSILPVDKAMLEVSSQDRTGQAIDLPRIMTNTRKLLTLNEENRFIENKSFTGKYQTATVDCYEIILKLAGCRSE